MSTPAAPKSRPLAVDALTALGLARNEALAYVTLLEDDGDEGLTGYEVAARSGIPRSAVYTVLAKLEAAGAAFALGDKPQRYQPTDPEAWIATRRREREAREDVAAEALARLPKRVRPEPVWTISRYDEVLDRMAQMIAGAKTSITLSVWAREADALAGPLQGAADRALHRVLYSPEPVALPGFACWCDALDDPAKAAWSHKVILVVDHREALIGGSEPNADNHAVWTANPSLIDLAVNHVILDITRLATALGVDPTEDVAPMMRPHL